MQLHQSKLINTTQINKSYRRQFSILIRKIQNVSGLVTTNVLNKKISEVEKKIPNTSN